MKLSDSSGASNSLLKESVVVCWCFLTLLRRSGTAGRTPQPLEAPIARGLWGCLSHSTGPTSMQSEETWKNMFKKTHWRALKWLQAPFKAAQFVLLQLPRASPSASLTLVLQSLSPNTWLDCRYFIIFYRVISRMSWQGSGLTRGQNASWDDAWVFQVQCA